MWIKKNWFVISKNKSLVWKGTWRVGVLSPFAFERFLGRRSLRAHAWLPSGRRGAGGWALPGWRAEREATTLPADPAASYRSSGPPGSAGVPSTFIFPEKSGEVTSDVSETELRRLIPQQGNVSLWWQNHKNCAFQTKEQGINTVLGGGGGLGEEAEPGHEGSSVHFPSTY